MSAAVRSPTVGFFVCLASVLGCADPPGEAELASTMEESSGLDPTRARDTTRFGFGVVASPARVALWDVDIKPDGEGLPAGQGTVADGEVVYRQECAQCHGATGVEGPNDRLVSTVAWEQWPRERAIGNYWPYASTLFDYVRRAMPQTTPGSLTDDEVYGVVAYLLFRNGIVEADVVLNAESLSRVEMPARDRFVEDDRVGGPDVR